MCVSWLPQEREDEELLALAAMSGEEFAGEAAAASGGGATDSATDGAADGTATAAPQSATAGAAANEAAQAPRAHQCTPPLFGSQNSAQVGDLCCQLMGLIDRLLSMHDAMHTAAVPSPAASSQDLGMADHSAVAAGVPAEDAAVGSTAPDPVQDVELAPQCDSLVPPDVDLADVDDEELLQMALA